MLRMSEVESHSFPLLSSVAQRLILVPSGDGRTNNLTEALIVTYTYPDGFILHQPGMAEFEGFEGVLPTRAHIETGRTEFGQLSPREQEDQRIRFSNLPHWMKYLPQHLGEPWTPVEEALRQEFLQSQIAIATLLRASQV